MAAPIKGITIEIGGSTTKFEDALKKSKKETRSLSNEMRDLNKALKLDPKNTELLAQKQNVLKESISATENQLQALNQAQEKAKEQFEKGELGADQYRALQREIIATQSHLENLKKEAESMKWESLDKAAEKLTKVSGKLDSAGKMLMPVTAGIMAAGGASIAAAMDLDNGYDTIITKTGATGDALESLQEQMDSVFTQLPTDAEKAGVAIGEVNTRFGLTGDQLGELSKKFIQFSEINGTDLNGSIDSVDAIMTKFGVDTDQTGSVLGLLTKAGQDTGISMDSLYSSLETNGAVLKEMDFGLEESVNLLAQFESSGVDSSTALAALKKAQQNATKEGKTMDEAMQESIEGIKDAKTETEALQIATDLFGKKGAAEMTQAIREGRFSLDDLSGSLNDYQSTVTDTYNSTLDPWDQMTVATNNLKVSGAELASELLGALQPAIEATVDKVKKITEWVKTLDSSQKQQILKIAGIIATVAPVLLILSKVTLGVVKMIGWIKKIGPAIQAVKGAMAAVKAAMLANPAVLIIAAIVAVIAILVTLYTKCEWFRDGVNKIFAAIKDAFFTAFNAINTFFTETLPAAVSGVIEFIKANWGNILLFLVNPFAGAFKLLYDNCTGFRNFIDGIIQQIQAFFQNLWNSIMALYSGAGAWFSQRFMEAYTGITNAFSSIGQWFSGRWSDIKGAFSTVGTFFQDAFNTACSNVKDAFDGIGQWFQTNVIDAIKEKFEGFSLKEAGEKIMNSFVKAIKSIHIPKLQIEWGESEKSIAGLTVKVPVPHISWNAKGGIFTGPGIAGWYDGKLQGVGEKGPEAVLPLTEFYDRLEKYIRKAINEVRGGKHPEPGKPDGSRTFTQNNYYTSPKALSPYEAARQTRNATRNMVLQIQRS